MNIMREFDISNSNDKYFGIAVDTEAIVKTFTAEYNSNQTAVEIVAGVGGYITEIRGILIETEATSGEVSVFFTSGNLIKLYASKINLLNMSGVNIKGNDGESIKLTTTTSTNKVYIAVTYVLRKII